MNATFDSNVFHICDDSIRMDLDYRIRLATLLEAGENIVFGDPNLYNL